MFRIGFLIFVIIISFSFKQLNSLHNSFVFHAKIDQKADYITTDKLGNLYVLDNNQLLKYNQDLHLEKTYSNLNLGTISFIDASNPLKIMLYYESFGKVEFLDNTLSPTSDPVSLGNLGLELATLVCTSYDNGLWIYDPQVFRLVRLDNKLNDVFSSGNISQITGNDMNPVFMTESNNQLYVNDPQTGLLVFDQYGTYYKTIPIKTKSNFQIIDEQLYYFSESSLHVYNLKTHDEKLLTLPEKDPILINLFRDAKQIKLFILDKEKISVYLFK